MCHFFRRRGQDTAAPGERLRGEMTLVEHLEELRRRLLVSVVAVFVATVVSLVFSERLMALLLALVKNAKPDVEVQALEIPETFFTSMQISLVAGLILAMPVLVWQLWCFLRPGLLPNERRYILIGLPLVTLFFAGGVAFSYFVALPAALRFLLNFGSDLVQTRPQLGPYLGFVATLLLWSGVGFELPIVLFFLAKIQVVNYKRLSRWRKYALLVICIFAAIITPTPDPVNMLIVATPLYVLYELGVLFARLA